MRRRTREVNVGGVGVGGVNPVRIQSMTTAAPDDVDGTVEECVRLHEVGCEISRISTPKVSDAALLAEVKNRLSARGIATPLVADIHFAPPAAMEAARHADKVRINPGNFADRKAGKKYDMSDEMYKAEIRRIEERFIPLVQLLKSRRAAMRIGTNHGSLSDRIMCHYGDTPDGMVESALEYARIAQGEDYHEIVLSMKASNPRVMTEAYRLLHRKMRAEGMDYPTHVGVTEAGEGEDARIKSSVGIGAVLADGMGDTIRVSLAEPPEAEIPVCRELVTLFENPRFSPDDPPLLLPSRRASRESGEWGGANPVRIFGGYYRGFLPEFEIPCEGDPREIPGIVEISDFGFETADPRPSAPAYRLVIRDAANAIHFVRRIAPRLGDAPIVLSFDPSAIPAGVTLEVAASAAIGIPLIEGYGDAIEILPGDGRGFSEAKRHNLAISLLQNTHTRISRVDIVACPSCGRTLFGLPEVTQMIKSRFSHLKGVRIAVMGCIVNGPGEMADADFGFVGGAPGRISLYKGHEVVESGIPIADAYDRMVNLIRKYDMWIDPPAA